jgi:hypothetical protein
MRHHRQELGEVDLTAAVCVDLVAVIGWVARRSIVKRED